MKHSIAIKLNVQTSPLTFKSAIFVLFQFSTTPLAKKEVQKATTLT